MIIAPYLQPLTLNCGRGSLSGVSSMRARWVFWVLISLLLILFTFFNLSFCTHVWLCAGAVTCVCAFVNFECWSVFVCESIVIKVLVYELIANNKIKDFISYTATFCWKCMLVYLGKIKNIVIMVAFHWNKKIKYILFLVSCRTTGSENQE